MSTESSVGDFMNEEGELMLGTSFHGFMVERILGKGGFGITYLLRDPENEELSVLKAILPDRFADRSSIESFYKEITRLNQIPTHPNIVPIRVSWIDPQTNTPYLVMDHISGGDLWSYVKSGNKLSIHACWWVLLNLLEGMRFLSEDVHIIHRDLKPQNMLIDKNGIIKVSDFGLAKMGAVVKAIEGPVTRAVQSGVAGTLQFMSPEQVRGDKIIDGRSDMWSIGVSLYWLTTGKLPFHGRTLEEDIINREPTAPSLINPQIDKHMESVILRCLKRDAAERYGSFTELKAVAMMYANSVPDFLSKVATNTSFINIDPANTYLMAFFDPDKVRAVSLEQLAPDGSDWLSYSQRVYNLIGVGDLNSAQLMVDNALAHDPDHPVLLCYRAMLFGHKGHFNEATKAFQEVFEHKDPRNRRVPAIAYEEAIKFYILTSQYDRGRAIQSLAEERLSNETDPDYRKHFEDTMRDAIARLHHGMDQSVADYLGLDVNFDNVFNEPSDETLHDLNQFSAANSCQRAIEMVERGLYEPALRAFRIAVALAPDYGEAWADLGTCLMEMERYSESFDALEKAIKLIPHDFTSWFHLAKVCGQLGQSEKALECYSQALELDPNHTEALFHKGLTLSNEFRNYHDALICFEKAQRLGHPEAANMVFVSHKRLGDPWRQHWVKGTWIMMSERVQKKLIAIGTWWRSLL